MNPTTWLARRFFSKVLMGAVGFAGALFFWLGWGIYQGQHTSAIAQAQSLRVAKLQGTILHLDEVLTMSARMAAATADLRWEERYRCFEPELDAAIQEASRLVSEAYEGETAGQTDAANLALIEMEHLAFDLVRHGRSEEARALLASAEYERHKGLYAEGMARFGALMERSIAASLLAEEQESRSHMAYISGIALLLVAGWLSSLVYLHRRHQEVAAHQQAETEQRIRAERAHADYQVTRVHLALQRLRNEILLMEREDDWLKVVDVFQHELRSLVDCHGTSINLVDPEGGGGIFHYHWEGQTRTVTTPEVPPAVRTALDTAAPHYRRTRADIDRIDPGLNAAVRSVVDVPFGQAGTVAANSLKENAFSDDDLQVLQQFAAAVGEGVRRLADLRALARREQQLQQARRQELVGQLAAGVAHEINNPLTSVIGYAQLLLRRGLPAAVRGDAETILAEGRRAHAIAQRLLEFPGARPGEWVIASLDDLVANVVDLVRFHCEGEGVLILTDLAGVLPSRPLQPVALQQLLLALLDNSRRALRLAGHRSGTVRLSTWTGDGRLGLAVEVDGAETAGDEADLSLARRTAALHGGSLRCEAVAAGARIVLDLPVAHVPGVAAGAVS